MLARQTGLTKTYNMVHGPKCLDLDVVELRQIREMIDEAVFAAGLHDKRNQARRRPRPAEPDGYEFRGIARLRRMRAMVGNCRVTATAVKLSPS
jgi:hypothetical protein